MTDNDFDMLGGTEPGRTVIDPTDILLALMAESATIARDARRDDDHLLAAVAYGRVSAIFDIMLTFGMGVPGESPAAIIDMAEALADEPTDPDRII